MSRKAGKSIYRNGYIECACGNRVEAGLEDELTEEAKERGESMEDDEEYTCGECGRVYKVTVGVTCVIETDFVNLEEQERQAVLSDGTPVILQGFVEGDVVSIPDGNYVSGNLEYIIEGGKVKHIWNVKVTESQLKLAI